MFKISHHFLIFISACILGSFYNFYFLQEVLALSSYFDFVLIIFLLVIILAFSLEILCLIPKSTKIILSLMILIAGISSFPINLLHIGITDDLLASVIEANPREIKETLSLAFILHFGIAVILPCILLWRIPIKELSIWRDLKAKMILLFIYPLLIAGLWFGVGKELTFLFKNHRLFYYILNPISPIRSSVQLIKSLQIQNIPYTQVGLDATLTPRTKPRAVVLIIGESARAQNFFLNGYTRNTNPYTSKQRVISFKDFSSCGVITAISVPCMLTDYTQRNYERDLSKHHDSLLDIAQRAGISTYYIGNNGGGCVGDFCIRLPQNQVKFYNDGNLDGVMLEPLREILLKAKGDVFIILHQMGSHGQAYFLRYPKEFEIFLPTCKTNEIQKCSYEELLNTYDNTLVYTDYLIDANIKELQKVQNRFDVALWYISDHGESLGERGMYMHGGLPYLLAPDTQKKVPSILWLGSNNEDFLAFKAQENAPLNHDYVFHTLLKLLGIQTQAYDANLDIASHKSAHTLP